MRLRLILAASLLALTVPAPAQDRGLREAVAEDYRANLADLFDHFHRNPELSGLEVRTAARMARELRALGYTDEQISEVVGLVSLQLLTGAFNLVAGIHPSMNARSAA